MKKKKEEGIKGEGKRGKKSVCKSQQRGAGGRFKGPRGGREDEALQDSFTSDLTTSSHLHTRPGTQTPKQAFLQTLPSAPAVALSLPAAYP